MGHYRKLITPIVALGVTVLAGCSFVASPLKAEQRQTTRPPATTDTPAHWPRFRGPGSNPVSDNPNLPVKWSRTEND